MFEVIIKHVIHTSIEKLPTDAEVENNFWAYGLYIRNTDKTNCQGEWLNPQWRGRLEHQVSQWTWTSYLIFETQ